MREAPERRLETLQASARLRSTARGQAENGASRPMASARACAPVLLARFSLGGSVVLPRESHEDDVLHALPKTAGVNVAVWNLQHKGAELIENGKLDFGGPVFGPMAIPGAYSVRLTVGGTQLTRKFNLLPDPRVQLAEADYKAQLATALAIRDDVTRLTLLVRQLRSVRQQLKVRNDLLKNDAKAAQLTKDSEAMMKKLDDLEKQIHNPEAEVVYDILAFKGGAKLYSRIASLHDQAADGDGPPTQGVREVYADQKKELDGYEAEMKKLLGELAGLNTAAKKLDLPHVVIPETAQLVSGK